MSFTGKIASFGLGIATSLFLLSPVPHDDIWVRAAIAEAAIADIRADRGLPARPTTIHAPVGPTHLSYWVDAPSPEQIRTAVTNKWNDMVLSLHGGVSKVVSPEKDE